jgi:hypothetical protein
MPTWVTHASHHELLVHSSQFQEAVPRAGDFGLDTLISALQHNRWLGFQACARATPAL